MAKRISILLVVAASVSTGVLLQAQERNPGAGLQTGARVRALRAAADSDVVFDQVVIATDASGRARVKLVTTPPRGQLQRYFWAIDRNSGEYWVLKLTDNPFSDAARVRNVYRRLGVDVSSDRLATHLLPETDRQREFRQEYETKRSAMAALRVAVDKLKSPDIRPAVFVDNRVNSNLDLGTEGEDPLCDGNLRPVSSVLLQGTGARTIAARAARAAQWTEVCYGLSAVSVMTYEPAKWLFNVDHLNETEAQTSYELVNGFLTYVNRAPNCWWSQETFADTHWFLVNSCPETFNQGSNTFQYSVTGEYRNYDFIEKFFNTAPDPNQWVGIVSTASAWRTAYGPNSEWDYFENGTELAFFWPNWLLTGVIIQAHQESCDLYCTPSEQDVWFCEEFFMWVWDYEICECRQGSPILIDVNRDGFTLSDAVNGVRFDLFGDGRPVQTAWTRSGSDDSFLALDRNGNGTIDDGAELFGNNTPQPAITTTGLDRKKSPNGFLALAVYDRPSDGGNQDGLITEDDAIYQSLRLWRDSNHNGVSEASELVPLSNVGVRSISLHYGPSKKVDDSGNLFGLWSHVMMDRDLFDPRPLQRRAVDVSFDFLR